MAEEKWRRWKNPDGSAGGWIEDTAQVDVLPKSLVWLGPNVEVSGLAKISGQPVIMGKVRIHNTEISDWALIKARPGSRISLGGVKVFGEAIIEADDKATLDLKLGEYGGRAKIKMKGTDFHFSQAVSTRIHSYTPERRYKDIKGGEFREMDESPYSPDDPRSDEGGLVITWKPMPEEFKGRPIPKGIVSPMDQWGWTEEQKAKYKEWEESPEGRRELFKHQMDMERQDHGGI